MATTTEEPATRPERIHQHQIYELRDRSVPIYRGQTRLPLKIRLKTHWGSCSGSSSLKCYIQQMKDEDRPKDDLSIAALDGYDTEREAIQDQDQLLNDHEGKLEPPPQDYQWSEEDAAMLGEVPDAEIARRLDISQYQVMKARLKLGLAVPNDKFLGSFSDEQVLAIRRQHKETDLSYESIAEQWGVCWQTIRNLVRGDTYQDVPHPDFSEEERHRIEDMIDEGRGAQSIGQTLSISPSLIEREFQMA